MTAPSIKRKLNLLELVNKKSYFLFGPRGTGKSYLINECLKNKALIINLLRSEDYRDLSLNPEKLRERVRPNKDKIVVIDEVQKIPQLLNEVHHLIETYKIHFLLTGSSTRKLKSKDANLLGGRARKAELFPLIYSEVPHFQLEKYLRYGGLPMVVESPEPLEDLSAYLTNYLIEEIKLEGTVRKIDFFHRFLETAALYSSEIVNFSNVSRDIGVSEPTIKSYYQILEDTLIGFSLAPWRKGTSRKAVASHKFYFFDTGVLHTILRSPTELDRNSDLFGKTFEQFIAQEIRAYLSYNRIDAPFNFWRSLDQYEVDFVIDNKVAIEVKSSKKVKKEFFSGLKQIKNEGSIKSLLLITQDPIEGTHDQIQYIHWKTFLNKLWDNKIL